MKKRILILSLTVLHLFIIPLAAYAAPIFVHDNAGLMSESEISQLESLALELSSETGLDLVILTVDTIGAYSAEKYADDFYDLNGYSEDGILFMLAMQERKWYISTCGDAVTQFSDYSIDILLDTGLPYFSEGTYFDGFYKVLNTVPHCTNYNTSEQIENTNVYSAAESARSSGSIIISALIGAVVSGIVLLIMRSAMNTKRRQRSAVDYMIQGSYQLRTRHDIFLYSQVSKTPRQQSSSSGSSSHRGSSGRIHGGGGRKF